MKPFLLTVEAFGPYAAKQVFDFRKLGGRSFFLIHGPTGAGKTTILDAICYALYGDTSGAERNGEQMRCQQAAPAISTQVTFDFALGNESYRVTRSPEQQRPKKRGGGTTTQPMSATLWQRTGLDDDAIEGTVLASQASKVTDHVERLLGFRSDQFRQVVMLPQGKFRELLTAGSSQREEILEALFHTEMYRRIQEALKEKAKGIEDEIKKVRELCEFTLGEAKVDTPADLGDRQKKLETQRTELKERLESLRQDEERANSVLTIAHQTNTKLQEQKDAHAGLTALESRREEITRKRDVLNWAKLAAAVVTAEAALSIRISDAGKRQNDLQGAEGALARAKNGKQAAIQQMAAQEARQGERDTLTANLAVLNDLTAKVTALSKAKAALAGVQGDAARSNREYSKAKGDLVQLENQIGQQQSTLNALRETGAGLDGLKLAVAEAEKLLTARRELAKLQTAIAQAKIEHQKLIQKVEQAEGTATRAKTGLADLQQTWNDGQAAILAQRLVSGEPCPVCGSTEHPDPATSSQRLPSEMTLKAKRTECDTADKAVAAAKTEERDKATALVELESRCRSITESLDNLAEQSTEVFEQTYLVAVKNRQAAESAIQQVSALEKSLKLLKEELQEDSAHLDVLNGDQQKASAAAEQALGVVRGQEEGIPASLRDPDTLKAAIDADLLKLDALRVAFENARRLDVEADKAMSAATQLVQSARSLLDEANRAVTEAQSTFAEQLAQNGFADADAYKSAKRSEAQITELDSEISKFDGNVLAAKQRADHADQAAAGLLWADMKTLEDALSTAQAVHRAAISDEANAIADLGRVNKWLERLGTLDGQLRKLEQDYAVCGRVSEVANGKNAGGITLQRFVLAWLLDDVLDAASIRLRVMSRNRYQLQRVRERLDQRSASGLDLEVFDSHTGMSRSVATLSGGESFLASLSLALGLADVVQTYAGGVHLETMFVDEGFGSLDPEALDLALRSLIDLQKGGRLVGIISHVPELRDRIDARLEITTGQGGSSAQFVVS